jgi:RNA polymerase sigma-70 factor, ECF subfamily
MSLAIALMQTPDAPIPLSGDADRLRRIAVSQDRSAFAELFDLYGPKVKAFMMRKGATAEQAEDLVQETMISVWTKAALYVPERGGVSTWIFTIARNLRIDRLRREKSNQFTDIDDYDAESDDMAQDDALSRFQEDTHVAKALAQICRTAGTAADELRGRPAAK